MPDRTVLLGLLAATALAGCSRPDARPQTAEVVPPKAAEPLGDRLAAPVPLEVDGKPLVSDDGIEPFVGDFDGDGVPDLLMGHGGQGRLLVYRNVGTAAAPRLGGPQWFDDLVPTGRVPKGWGNAYFRPQLADLDGDGRPDLLTGSNCCDGRGFFLFRQNADGSWAPRRRLEMTFQGRPKPKLRPSFVTAADWDGDGHTDLLTVGQWGKTVEVALGPIRPTRDDEPIDFTHEVVNFTGEEDMWISAFAVADWDRDGKPDLLICHRLPEGGQGVYWYRNLGGPGLPKLAERKLLVAENTPGDANSPRPRIDGFCVADWNGDGRPDLILTRQDWSPDHPGDKRGRWRSSAWLYRRE